MKILIVDDSRAMRLIVGRTLRQAGFGDHEVVEAENGRQGLEKTKSEKPNLVLCDWNMPEMNGLEFLLALRGGGDSTPFGFITTEGSSEMRDMALSAGAMFLITKPFTADVFEENLGAVLT